ncbi:ninjurin-1-like [Ptychodera flava]|uniref:ninjurin-1-like n=1 Tax=Ptychodera flava TaxID=63121 RepID=UPI003969D6C1
MTLGAQQDTEKIGQGSPETSRHHNNMRNCNGNTVFIPMARIQSVCPDDDSLIDFDVVDRSTEAKLKRDVSLDVTSEPDEVDVKQDRTPNGVLIGSGRKEEKLVRRQSKSLRRLESSVIRTFNANTYASKKTITQGMLDIALLTANTSYLKLLCQQYIEGNPPNFFYFLVTLLTISIILQIIVGLLLFFKIKYNILKAEHQRQADICNNAATVMVMVITVINVIIASFSNHALSNRTADEIEDILKELKSSQG